MEPLEGAVVWSLQAEEANIKEGRRQRGAIPSSFTPAVGVAASGSLTSPK